MVLERAFLGRPKSPRMSQMQEPGRGWRNPATVRSRFGRQHTKGLARRLRFGKGFAASSSECRVAVRLTEEHRGRPCCRTPTSPAITGAPFAPREANSVRQAQGLRRFIAHRHRANSRSNIFSCLAEAKGFGHSKRALSRLAGTHAAAASFSGSSRMNSCLGLPETDEAVARLRNGPRIIIRAFAYVSRGAYFNRKSPVARIIIRLVPGRSDCIIMTFVLQTVTINTTFHGAARAVDVELPRHFGTANTTLVVFESHLP